MSDEATQRPKGKTRQRLLQAAETIARSEGPGAMSLDAVAAEAGVSKGGLLYHFPSKSKLLQAMVDDFLSRFDNVLQEAEQSGRPNAVIRAYIRHFMDERRCRTPPPSGLLAVIAGDPAMLAPIQRHHRNFLARIRANATDPDFALVAFLSIEAIRDADLFETQVLDEEEISALAGWLLQRLQ